MACRFSARWRNRSGRRPLYGRAVGREGWTGGERLRRRIRPTRVAEDTARRRHFARDSDRKYSGCARDSGDGERVDDNHPRPKTGDCLLVGIETQGPNGENLVGHATSAGKRRVRNVHDSLNCDVSSRRRRNRRRAGRLKVLPVSSIGYPRQTATDGCTQSFRKPVVFWRCLTSDVDERAWVASRPTRDGPPDSS
jgi:hypothetical protein